MNCSKIKANKIYITNKIVHNSNSLSLSMYDYLVYAAKNMAAFVS